MSRAGRSSPPIRECTKCDRSGAGGTAQTLSASRARARMPWRRGKSSERAPQQVEASMTRGRAPASMTQRPRQSSASAVSSAPACTWGAHGCAPHHLCKAEWPSLLSVPACKPLEPQALPQNHPPVPAGAGLCAAALEAAGRSWPFGLPATVIVAGLCAGCGGAALRMRRRKKAPYEPSQPPNLEAWLAEHVRAPISESRQHPPPASRSG